MTVLDTLPTTAATHGKARDTGLRMPQMLLTALFTSAGFHMLLGLQQQMAEHFTRPGVGEWFGYLAGAIGSVFPALSHCAALGLAGVVIGALVTQPLV